MKAFSHDLIKFLTAENQFKIKTLGLYFWKALAKNQYLWIWHPKVCFIRTQLKSPSFEGLLHMIVSSGNW